MASFLGSAGMQGRRGRAGRVVPPLAFGGAPAGERRDAAESRRRVLGVARELFSERGVDAVSMHEIGRAAGVGQGTLYRRFKHKGALCMALLFEGVEGLYGRARDREESGGPALEQLMGLLEDLACFNEENAPLLGAVRDAVGGERRVEMYRNPFYSWLRATVVALLGRAVEEGEAREGLDVEAVAEAVLAPLNVDLYLYQRAELGMGRGRILTALRGLLLDGLRREGTAR
ncbi:TetR/AcrR family transcriptional regulator [Rubrobacter marinus]|uniref:TetR/AcrR family transcriptional regulator n=1 Tax=Rubrobacter marinus TaxID=2653852 RepID=UPI0014087F46|nr:TetR/AcrR family transcriptional regulator [Rubrobacter marinus]